MFNRPPTHGNPDSPPVRLHPNLASIYREKVSGLQEALKDPLLHDEAMDILRSLIERVEMEPSNDGYEITLVGEIAHMIGLSTGKSGQEADHIPSSVKVVARARYSFYLLVVADRLERRFS